MWNHDIDRRLEKSNQIRGDGGGRSGSLEQRSLKLETLVSTLACWEFETKKPMDSQTQLIVISSNNNGFWGLCSDLIIPPVCDETQNLNDTDSKIPNFFETNSDTFFLVLEIFEIGSGIFFGTKIFRDRFRDFCRYQIFPILVPIPPEKMTTSRYRYLYDTGTHYKSSKFQNFGDEN